MPISQPRHPFDLASTLQSGQVFHWHGGGLADGGSEFIGAMGNDLVRLRQRADGSVEIDPPGAAVAARDYLGIDHPMPEILASFPQGDAPLATAVAFCPGIRILRQPKWECLATFITSSLKQVPHIRKISLTLRERFGEEIRRGEARAFAYPKPEAIAEAGEAALRECGLGYRAKFLHATAELIARGDADLEAIAALPDADARAALCAFPGVGEKIADCTLLFAYARYAAFPIDVWIDRCLRRLYFPRRRKPLSARQLRDFAAKHFGPHAGYAQQFLFHHARLTKLA